MNCNEGGNFSRMTFSMEALGPIWPERAEARPRQGWLGGEALASGLAMVLLVMTVVSPWMESQALPDDRATTGHTGVEGPVATTGRETLVAGYVGAPFYYRSKLELKKPGGTDLKLDGLGWDGDALYFPIDGGVRALRWHGSVGWMVDFMHNKAVPRLGRGSHGRKLDRGGIERLFKQVGLGFLLPHPEIDVVGAQGTYKGQPVPARMKLSDVFERIEFTHGHNVLLMTGMARLGALTPKIRPYAGIGAGVAVPHVEVWHPGEPKENQTNEYQYAGPAAQLVAGLEIRAGRWSYFVEYKFTYAWIRGALTGDKSWLNSNMPGDLWRQFRRWWSGEPAKLGTFATNLGAHQVVFGAGYWLGGK